MKYISEPDLGFFCVCFSAETRTGTNTNPNDTEANALRKQSKCGVIHKGEGHWPKFLQRMQNARHWRASVVCDVRNTKFHWQRGQNLPFSAQGAYCSVPGP